MCMKIKNKIIKKSEIIPHSSFKAFCSFKKQSLIDYRILVLVIFTKIITSALKKLIKLPNPYDLGSS